LQGKRHKFHEFPRTKGAEDMSLMKRTDRLLTTPPHFSSGKKALERKGKKCWDLWITIWDLRMTNLDADIHSPDTRQTARRARRRRGQGLTLMTTDEW